jgi:hypothetical protein
LEPQLGAWDNPLLLLSQPWRSGCGIAKRAAPTAGISQEAESFFWTRA